MEVMTYLKIIGRYWWLILLTTLVSTGAAAAISLTKAPSYTVQARVVARPATSVLTNTRDLISTVSEMGMRSVIGTYAQIFSSAEVVEAAHGAVGLDAETARDYPLQANVLPDTTVIEVSAKGRDPRLLADYVNATVNAAVTSSRDLFGVIELEPLEAARVPQEPTSPIPSRDIPLGAGLGLGLGVLLALAIEYLRTPRRVEHEPQIRSLVPSVFSTFPTLPSGQQEVRNDIRLINGGQEPKQEYLVPGAQPRVGWQNTEVKPLRRDDSFPG